MRLHGLVALALIAGCGKKPDEATPAPATTSRPLKVDLETLWADFHGATDNVELLNKYRDPVVITGSVSRNGPLAFFDVGGSNKVALEFADPSSAAKLEAGSTVTVTCKIAGTAGSAHRLYAIECTR